MLTRLFAIIRKEFLHIIRDPRTLAVMFITPIMQMVLLGSAAQTNVRNVEMAVFDQDRSAHSRRLVDTLVESDQFAVHAYVSSESELAQLIDGGQARAGLIIPPTYSTDLASGRGAQVAFVLDGSDPTVAASSLSAAQLIGQFEATTVQQQTLARRGMQFAQTPPIEVRTRVWYNPDMNNTIFMIPALIGMVLQFQATLLTASSIVRERERGTIEQLIVTPIRSVELIVGKLLPYAFIAMLIALEVLLIGSLLFGVPIKGSVSLLLGISLLFLISTLAIGLLVSTVANTQQEAFLLTFLTILPSVFLSGFIYPIAAMPVILQAASGLIPLTYFLVVVRGIIIKGIGLEALVPQVWALAIFGTALIVLATIRFRKRLD